MPDALASRAVSLHLAVDVGGTSTRAAVVDASGECLAVAAAGAGNPTSAGHDPALTAITAATREAAARAGVELVEVRSAVAAIAGAGGTAGARLLLALNERLPTPLTFGPDLLGMYLSATVAPDGYVLLAGTGAIAARVVGGELDHIVDGAGWLIGDDGSGFWIGHRVVRRVIAELDGRRGPTALTPALLGALGLERLPTRRDGREDASLRLIDTIYGDTPTALARFVPLAFDAAAAGDDAATAILDEAADLLADTLGAAIGDAPGAPDTHAAPSTHAHPSTPGDHPPVPGRPLVPGDRPLVLGGGVLSRPEMRARLDARITVGNTPLMARDGLVGAAVMALRAGDVAVDDALHRHLTATVAARRAR